MNAALRMHNGAMTLFVNGEAQPCVGFKATELDDDALFSETVEKTVADMAARGVHVHYVPVYFGWSGPNDYDFASVDQRVNETLAADPKAWIIIRIQAGSMAPRWWMELHPDAVHLFADSAEEVSCGAQHQTPPAPSLGSDFYQTQAPAAMTALAEHVRGQDYADRIIGYLPTALNSNEWFLRSYDELHCNDFCPAMQRTFSAWLAEQYGVQAINPVPDIQARFHGDMGFIHQPDPRQARAPVSAYYTFLNDRCAEAILAVVRALREAHAPDQILVGTFYGYLIGLANFHWLADSGHLAMDKLLVEDGPDFTSSPLEYFTRNIYDRPGGGFCWSQSTGVDSARVAGKAYIGEDDFCPPDKGMPGWSSAADSRQDVELLKRNFTFTFCKGQLQWWYDLHGHWYESPKRLSTVEQCTQIARQGLARDRSNVAQVAVVVDEDTPKYLALDTQLQRAICWENIHRTFSEIGTPIDILLRSDMARTDMSRYRAIFFPSCFAMNDEDRQRIDALKADGRLLMFYQADGLIDPEDKVGLDVDRIGQLANMHIVAHSGLLQHRLTLMGENPLTEGCGYTSFGVHMEKAPCFVVSDAHAQPLARYSACGPVGLAIRSFDNWTSVYCGVPAPPPQLIRNLLQHLGVHVWTDSPVPFYANASYCGLFSRRPQTHTIHLPRPSCVQELFQGKVRHETPVTDFTFEGEDCTTYLFELTDPKN